MDFIRSSVVAGTALVAFLSTAAACMAATAVAVTADASATGCTSTTPVSDAAGTVAAWQSNCNPAAGNADGSVELFRAVVGSAPEQLTSGTGCSSMRPSISNDGTKIAFESTCNLLGANGDGNVEIFLWRDGVLVQLTTSTGCDNVAPSISGLGAFVAFDSTCNTSGTNNGGRGSEIFRVTTNNQKTLKQLTTDDIGACDSAYPSISADGSLVAFDSDCNLTGQNEDFAIEIFTVSSSGTVKQRTFAPDDSCSSVRPSMDAVGTVIGFHSDCDFLGKNKDRNDEIFTIALDAAQTLRQVTEVPAGGLCASGEVHMASSGRGLAFSSYCNLVTGNADASIEVFHASVGTGAGGILAVTDGAGNCSSLAGGISSDGTRVLFDSDCKIGTSNPDRSVEIFRASACACGAPNTRGAPKTSDALLVLRAAVGSSTCSLCECDTNNNGTTTTSDALLVLKKSVGQNVTLICPAG